MALDHGESVRQARAGLALALADSTRATARRRLQIEGRGAYTRTLASEFEDIDFSFGDGDAGSGLGDLPFGQENRYDLGVAASQVLFAGGGIGASEKAARFGVDAAQISIEAARAALTLDVVGAYFDAALTDRLVAIAEESLAQAARTHVQAKAAFEVGDAAEFDVLRAEVARDSALAAKGPPPMLDPSTPSAGAVALHVPKRRNSTPGSSASSTERSVVTPGEQFWIDRARRGSKS